jgi:hypothetical protein
MLVAAGVVFALASVSGVVAWQKRGTSTDVAPQGSTPLNQQVVTTPAVNLARSFEAIERLTNVDSDANSRTAGQALAMLDSIAPMAVDDSDLVHIALLRAEAHFVVAEETKDSDPSRSAAERNTGCSFLKQREGKASSTRFNKRFSTYLWGVPEAGIPKTCE